MRLHQLLLLACLPLGAQTLPAWLPADTKAVEAEVIAWRRDIHTHPELGNRELRTSAKVAGLLSAFGLEVRSGIAATGVVGVLKGGRPGPCVALRADMDALPIQEATQLPFASETPGVMHACGHDAHTAMLLGAAKVLARHRAELPGTIVFIFQPAEEGAPVGESGGAARMLAEGLFKDLKPAAIFGLHQDPAAPAGTIGWGKGPVMAGSDTFDLRIEGRGAHGALPHMGVDAVLVAAETIEALQSIRSRRVNPMEPFVLSIGTIHGGDRFNVVAAKVEMSGTIRSFKPETRQLALEESRRIAEGVAAAHGAKAVFSVRPGSNPPLLNDPALVEASLPALRALGAPLVEMEPLTTSEDFAFYTREAPCFYFRLGTGGALPQSNHTATLVLDESAFLLGVRAHIAVAWSALTH